MASTLTWTCHVCGRGRPDPAISVLSTTVLVNGVAMKQNVRYCNDNPSCVTRAPGVSFLSEAPEPTLLCPVDDCRRPYSLSRHLNVEHGVDLGQSRAIARRAWADPQWTITVDEGGRVEPALSDTDGGRKGD